MSTTSASSTDGHIVEPTGYIAPSDDARRAAAGGVTFREVMSGQLTVGQSDPRAGYKQAGSSAVTMRATITIADVSAFVRDPGHCAQLCAELDLPRITGRVQSSAGHFGLFVPTSDARTTLMRYELRFEIGGKPHLLRGVKNCTAAPLWRLWRATTTLNTTLHDLSDSDERIVAAGIMRLGPVGLLAMLKTMHGIGTRPWVRIRSTAQFLGFFIGGLVSTYLLQRRA
jgi:hypothetical protein